MQKNGEEFVDFGSAREEVGGEGGEGYAFTRQSQQHGRFFAA